MGSRSRRWLNQSTYSRVAYSTWSRLRHGPFGPMSGLIHTNDRLREGVIVGIAHRADRRGDAGFGQPHAVADRQILTRFKGSSQHCLV